MSRVITYARCAKLPSDSIVRIKFERLTGDGLSPFDSGDMAGNFLKNPYHSRLSDEGPLVMDDPFIEDPSLEKMNNDDGDLAEPIDIFADETGVDIH
jgi:hypothetical protein